MLSYIAQSFLTCLSPFNLLMIAGGTLLGMLVGALPAFSSPMAIVVLLPLTYHMDATPALLLMMGVYAGSKLGGSYPAILLRTPGTPAAACTVLDGYQMAVNGQAGRALGYATMGSTLGGIFGWFLAVLFVPFLSSIAIKSSNADIALIGILGLVMVSAFIRGSMLKGLAGVLFGLLLGTIGLDPMYGKPRFVFGLYELISGIPFAAALVGFFGIAVVLSDLGMVGTKSEVIHSKVNLELPKLSEMKKYWSSILIGGLYGTAFGAIPGVGAETSTWVAYATVKNKSKYPEKFGTGIPEGIITPEATNNANCGGTLVPMLTLGIPGDGSTAIMLGAMILHGVTPGVTLMHSNPYLVYAIITSLLISTIFMFIFGLATIKYFVIFLQQDRAWLFPFILVLATLGAFSSLNSLFPIYIAITFGLVGFVFEKAKFPIVTVVLGIILGPIIEQNLRIALTLSGNNWLTFVNTPVRAIFILAIIGLITLEAVKAIKGFSNRKNLQTEEV